MLVFPCIDKAYEPISATKAGPFIADIGLKGPFLLYISLITEAGKSRKQKGEKVATFMYADVKIKLVFGQEIH